MTREATVYIWRSRILERWKTKVREDEVRRRRCEVETRLRTEGLAGLGREYTPACTWIDVIIFILNAEC